MGQHAASRGYEGPIGYRQIYAALEVFRGVRLRAGRCVTRRDVLRGSPASGIMPVMVAAAMAPRTNGFTPNTRPNSAPAKNTNPGRIKPRAFTSDHSTLAANPTRSAAAGSEINRTP